MGDTIDTQLPEPTAEDKAFVEGLKGLNLNIPIEADPMTVAEMQEELEGMGGGDDLDANDSLEDDVLDLGDEDRDNVTPQTVENGISAEAGDIPE